MMKDMQRKIKAGWVSPLVDIKLSLNTISHLVGNSPDLAPDDYVKNDSLGLEYYQLNYSNIEFVDELAEESENANLCLSATYFTKLKHQFLESNVSVKNL